MRRDLPVSPSKMLKPFEFLMSSRLELRITRTKRVVTKSVGELMIDRYEGAVPSPVHAFSSAKHLRTNRSGSIARTSSARTSLSIVHGGVGVSRRTAAT